MLITKEIEIKIFGNVFNYYKNNNISVIYNSVNKLPIHLVNPQSHLIVDAQCDICGKEVKIQFRRYNKSVNNGGYYTCSSKCGKEKRIKTTIERFGHENHFKSENFKEKTKKTSLIKWGTEHFRQSEKWKFENGEKEIKKRKDTIFQHFLKNNPLVVGQDDENFIINCEIHGHIKTNKKIFSTRKIIGTELCSKCKPVDKNISGKEVLVGKLIGQLYDGEIITSYKIGRKEIDVYLPEFNLGFEFNGLRWHSELFVDKNYHLNKTNLCKQNNVRLIHIFEDDFDNRPQIVKSIISNVLNKSRKVYARKTEIKKIENKNVIKTFLDYNHLQGFVNTNINYGLYHEGELISLMTFMKTRKILDKTVNVNEYELIRFCNKVDISVIGGASKLFKQFIKDYTPNKVLSYCDISWANGNLYKQLGFKYNGITKPNYFYVINKNRENRINYQKHKLVKKGHPKELTESQIMNNMGYFRIYNCGNEKYVYTTKD